MACGLCLRQRLAHLNFWYVSAFTWRNDLRQNAQTLFGCQCAYRVPALGCCHLTVSWPQQNTCIVAACKVDVNMLSCDYGQTYDQTHHGSVRTTRQSSDRADQGVIRVCIGHRGNSACFADGSTRGGAPALSARNKDSLISPCLEGQGSYARFDKP